MGASRPDCALSPRAVNGTSGRWGACPVGACARSPGDARRRRSAAAGETCGTSPPSTARSWQCSAWQGTATVPGSLVVIDPKVVGRDGATVIVGLRSGDPGVVLPGPSY